MPGRACPDCGVAMVLPHEVTAQSDYPSDGPLHQPTPFLRLSELARGVGVDVFDVPEDKAGGLAGALGVGIDDDEQVRATIGLAGDLDDELRTDVLAFALAIYTAEADDVVETPHGSVGIRRDRKPAAKNGVGHLAWHLLYSAGRETTSATFAVVLI